MTWDNLNYCWPRSMKPYDIHGPQWVRPGLTLVIKGCYMHRLGVKLWINFTVNLNLPQPIMVQYMVHNQKEMTLLVQLISYMKSWEGIHGRHFMDKFQKLMDISLRDENAFWSTSLKTLSFQVDISIGLCGDFLWLTPITDLKPFKLLHDKLAVRIVGMIILPSQVEIQCKGCLHFSKE